MPTVIIEGTEESIMATAPDDCHACEDRPARDGALTCETCYARGQLLGEHLHG